MPRRLLSNVPPMHLYRVTIVFCGEDIFIGSEGEISCLQRAFLILQVHAYKNDKKAMYGHAV